jgi:hypothetical protein
MTDRTILNKQAYAKEISIDLKNNNIAVFTTLV